MILVEKMTHDQEESTKESCFALDIKVYRESHSEVISVGEGFTQKTAPLFRYSPNNCLLVQRQNLKKSPS